MRFDLEQFLAITMALGTAGAIGVAVYSTQEAQAKPEAPAVTETVNEDEFPEAEPEPDPPKPEPAPAAEPKPAAAPMPAFDAPAEELEAAPGPQVEAW